MAATSLALRLCLLAASVTPVLSSCAYGTHLDRRAEDGAVKIGNFGYNGAIGPVNWVSLDPVANAACNTGTRQSPISMEAGSFTLIPGSDVVLNIPDMAEGTEFENLGTTVEVIAKGGTMTTAGVEYTLQQFHFHLPSEHLDNGTSQAMEMHMVWQSAAQEIAVIGMYINVANGAGVAAPVGAPAVNSTAGGKERRHARDTTLIAREGAAAGAAAAAPVAAAPAAALPSGMLQMGTTPQKAVAATSSNLLATVLGEVSKIATPGTKTETPPLIMSELVSTIQAGNFQTYSGSLTTPPCSEGVRWLVSTQKLEISADNFIAARDVIGFNARFSQNVPGQANLASLAQKAVVPAAAAAARE